jgi:prepilin-type N-terminal cleavage/methylation domain-containing protein
MQKFNKAFSIAEVLVTMMILGIIIVLTLPSVLKMFSSKETAAWKRAYSVLNSAGNRIVVEDNVFYKGLCSDNGHNCLRDNFAGQLSIVKSCDSGSVLGNCWHNTGSVYLNQSPVTWDEVRSGLVLNNGMLLSFTYEKSDCDAMKGTLATCGSVIVDVNGFKSPNQWGRDIFGAWITESGFKPFGTSGDSYESNCTPSSTGTGCGATVLRGETVN